MKLFIAPKTVNNHLFNARKKLNLHKSVEFFLLNNDKMDILTGNLRLTCRGREVFKLYLSGFTDTQIKEILGISYSSIRKHKEKMLIANNCDSMRALGALSQRIQTVHGDENDAI